MPKQYMVELAQDERDELEAVLKSSTRRAVSATKLQRARILLAVDQGVAGPALTDGQVVDALVRSSMIPSAGYLIDSKGTIPFWMLEKTCVLLGTSHSGT